MSDIERQHEILSIIAELADELGWLVAFPSESEEVPGLIIGTEEFVMNVAKALDAEPDGEIKTNTPKTSLH